MPTKTKLSKRCFPQGREITIENVREYEGFENVSEKEAEEIVRFFRVFSKLLFNIHMREVKQRWERKSNNSSVDEYN